jgi:transposase
MKLQLSTEEIKELQRIQKKDRFHRRRFIKATVLLMLHRGLSMEDIQMSLTLDDNTIKRYVKAFQEKGLKRYMEDGYVPYSGKLTQAQEQALSDHLDEDLYIDAKAICDYVKQTFRVRYTISGMRDVLHRLGFVYKQTKAVPSKADEAQQRAFLEETLPELLEEVAAGNAEVYFADGTHPTHNTKTGRGWIRKGQDFEIDCNSGRKRVNINAAIRATKPEHLVYDVAECINAQSTQRLCRKLLKKHPGKTIYLVCDNAGYNRCAWLQDWAVGQRIEFVFLPTYSPNLNLIERLWRFLRKEVLHSIYYDTCAKFRQAIIHFLENVKEHRNELRKLLTLNFRTVGNSSFHLAQTTS